MLILCCCKCVYFIDICNNKFKITFIYCCTEIENRLVDDESPYFLKRFGLELCALFWVWATFVKNKTSVNRKIIVEQYKYSRRLLSDVLNF